MNPEATFEKKKTIQANLSQKQIDALKQYGWLEGLPKDSASVDFWGIHVNHGVVRVTYAGGANQIKEEEYPGGVVGLLGFYYPISESLGGKPRIPDSLFGIEPKSGLEIGVWFDTPETKDRVRAYRGTCSVVIQFNKKTPEHSEEPMVVSRCPPCEWTRLLALHPGRTVKRWLILPL